MKQAKRATPSPVRPPRGGIQARHVGADGITLYSRRQAAAFVGCSEVSLKKWHASGRFVPQLRREGVWLYTREQLESYLRDNGSMHGPLAAQVFRQLEAGATPVAIVIALEADPRDVERMVDSYAALTGSWLIQGPGGPRKIWEESYRIGPLTPRKLRRALELCAASEALRTKLLAEVG